MHLLCDKLDDRYGDLSELDMANSLSYEQKISVLWNLFIVEPVA